MSAVRGTPKTIPAPEYAELPGIFNPSARRDVRKQNDELKTRYEDAVHRAEWAASNFNNHVEAQACRMVKPEGQIPDLAAAKKIRSDLSHKQIHPPYTNPAEYIADLKADGHIDEKTAQKIIGKLEIDGKVTPTETQARLVKHISAVEHIAALISLENPLITEGVGFNADNIVTPALYPKGSSDKERKKYQKDGTLLSQKELDKIPQDSPVGFLLEEEKKGHIELKELKSMLQWEKEKTQERPAAVEADKGEAPSFVARIAARAEARAEGKSAQR